MPFSKSLCVCIARWRWEVRCRWERFLHSLIQQIKSEWKGHSWKPSWVEPFFCLLKFLQSSLSPHPIPPHPYHLLSSALTHRFSPDLVHYSLFSKLISSCLPLPSLRCFYFYCSLSVFLLLLSGASVKWGQPFIFNAMSFLCFAPALWPRSLIQATPKWLIAFHVFPWVVSWTWQ